jgi:uncharacterized membrane protein
MNRENERAVQGRAVPVPGVSSSYGHGWHQLWRYFLELFVIGIIAFVITLPVQIFIHTSEDLECAGAVLILFAMAYTFLVANPVEYGVSFAYLKAARSDELKIKDMFEPFQNFWNAVLANLLVSVIIGLGIILLIVPGIIFACKLAFVSYLVVDKKMDVIPAVKESWRMTTGHAWKIFFMGLLAIPIALAGLICLIVGVIPAAMWIQTAFASLYYAVSRSEGTTGGEGVVVAETAG